MSAMHGITAFFPTRTAWVRESTGYFQLAWPLVVASMVNMSISITDVVMMAWIGPTALAGGVAASDFYSIVYYLAAGIVAGITPLMAQARGARRYGELRRVLQTGFWVVAGLSVPAVFLALQGNVFLGWLGVDDGIIVSGHGYAGYMAATLVPMLSVSIWHHFLAVHKRTRIIFVVTAIGLPVNALGNYAFMFGRLGAPALGLSGAGLSSLIVACTMLVTLTVYVLRDRRLRRYRLFAGITRPDLQTIRETVHIGTPIGLTNLGAMGVFLFSTVMMGIFGAHAVAAHAVAIRMAGVCYAIPMGLSQAATVRVGHAVGASRPTEATDAMAVGLLWAGIVGCCYLLALTTFAEPIARLVVEGTHTAEIVAQASAFLIALALIDPISTLGTVAAGVLRGVKDTRVPSAIAIGSHWAVGFSTSCLLAFAAGLQGLGIWIGLAVGCTTAGVAVLTRLAVVWRSTGQPVIRTHFA